MVTGHAFTLILHHTKNYFNVHKIWKLADWPPQKQNFGVLMLSGAYWPPKAAMEHVTCIACWMSSQSKSFARYPPYQESITFLFEAIFNFVGGG